MRIISWSSPQMPVTVRPCKPTCQSRRVQNTSSGMFSCLPLPQDALSRWHLFLSKGYCISNRFLHSLFYFKLCTFYHKSFRIARGNLCFFSKLQINIDTYWSVFGWSSEPLIWSLLDNMARPPITVPLPCFQTGKRPACHICFPQHPIVHRN